VSTMLRTMYWPSGRRRGSTQEGPTGDDPFPGVRDAKAAVASQIELVEPGSGVAD